jgi:hypothetical protein
MGKMGFAKTNPTTLAEPMPRRTQQRSRLIADLKLSQTRPTSDFRHLDRDESTKRSQSWVAEAWKKRSQAGEPGRHSHRAEDLVMVRKGVDDSESPDRESLAEVLANTQFADGCLFPPQAHPCHRRAGAFY